METTIDSNHPLFLHASDTPGTLLVSQQLTGIENYNLWSRSMKIVLLAKNKVGLVDGSCKRESVAEPLRAQWDRCNALVLSWILNTVSQELSAGIVFVSNASIVWADLKERFNKVDGSRIYFLHREIVTHVQNLSSISVYFSRLKLLWDEYDALVPFATCDCEVARDNSLLLNQQRLFQMLMGLNDTYSMVRSQILLMKPLPTVNQAYNMLVQEEGQRQYSSVSTQNLAEPTALYSSSGAQGYGQFRKKFNGICDHCHLKGHKKESCYRLIGYPPDFKFNRKGGGNVRQAANSATVENSTEGAAQMATTTQSTVNQQTPTFTAEQYQQILSLLGKDPIVKGTAHMAGMVSGGLAQEWILDTGATNHMTYNLDLLTAPIKCDSSSNVQLPNGNSTSVSHIGTCNLTSTKVLKNVLCDLCSGETRKIGRYQDGLYVLHLPFDTSSCLSAYFTQDSCLRVSINSLWHARLGHSSYRPLSHISSIQCNSSLENEIKECRVCPLAKQAKLPFPLSNSSSVVPFELIHIDLWGPYRVSTVHGQRYFLTIVDDYSRMTWIRLLKLKSDAFVTLNNFFNYVKNQFAVSVRKIRSDNGHEFFTNESASFFQDSGTDHQSSCVYTPQQNGVAERKHRHLLEVARALKFHSNVPTKFWGYCVNTACYLINYLPSAVLKWKCPFEVLYNRLPDFSRLRVFGCLAYATTPNYSDKFAPKAVVSVFMGYSLSQKGYILFSLESKAFFVSRDVVFHENVFPFTFPVKSSRLFPTSHSDVGFLDVDHISSLDVPCSSAPSTNPSVLQDEQVIDMTTINNVVPVEPVEQQVVNVPQEEIVRRSSRVQRQPTWLNDFVCTKVGTRGTNSISNFVSYVHLPLSTRAFVASISSTSEPRTYKEAMHDDNWIKAMQQEIAALESNGTWKIVDLPPGQKPIGCKWVYKIKYNADGTIERYKARLVAKGYNQQEGIDYQETFSPVTKQVTVRTIIALASMNNWPLYQMDVFNAFLQGDLYEEVYMSMPEGFCNQGGNRVCRLQKSLYGLKQASRQWNLKLTEALVAGGYTQSLHGYSMFTKRNGNKLVILLVYVDDLLITGSDQEMMDDLKDVLNQNFKMKDLGQLKYFLGIEVLRSKEGIILNQRKYAIELIADSGLGNAKVASTPLELNEKQVSVAAEEDYLEDVGSYQRLIGRLLYLTNTRPDIAFAIQHLSQFMHKPKKVHYNAALRVVRYVKKNPGLGILLPAAGLPHLTAYCDADWAACPLTRKSVTRYYIKLGESLVCWKSKKQNTVSRSSAEAEYRGMASTTTEVVWLRGLLLELGFEQTEPTIVYSDSQAALQIAANPVFHERTKHIEIDCHFIREKFKMQ
ncbi:hypothetical protein HRI_003826100 [Hibiscus trionum]|uniref:Integrase catalytic domain-containing protein n=1 Tax=Hibiscus trionum TaxID=183268 RepID=A0A9W7MH17_HIBTR|nr:hypothetical protein HRI_003826100 [Hibiscus trionum]